QLKRSVDEDQLLAVLLVDVRKRDHRNTKLAEPVVLSSFPIWPNPISRRAAPRSESCTKAAVSSFRIPGTPARPAICAISDFKRWPPPAPGSPSRRDCRTTTTRRRAIWYSVILRRLSLRRNCP